MTGGGVLDAVVVDAVVGRALVVLLVVVGVGVGFGFPVEGLGEGLGWGQSESLGNGVGSAAYAAAPTEPTRVTATATARTTRKIRILDSSHPERHRGALPAPSVLLLAAGPVEIRVCVRSCRGSAC